MVLARYLGDGDVDAEGVPKPCHVYGLDFQVGEWVKVESPQWAAKLAGNPLFEIDGKVPGAVKAPEPQPEPDPQEADEGDSEPATPSVEDPRKPLQDELRAKGVKFHHKLGEDGLLKLLAENS